MSESLGSSLFLQYPCAVFQSLLHSFLPYLLSHTRKAQLCLLFSLSNLKKTVFTFFSSRDPLASKKQTPI